MAGIRIDVDGPIGDIGESKAPGLSFDHPGASHHHPGHRLAKDEPVSATHGRYPGHRHAVKAYETSEAAGAGGEGKGSWFGQYEGKYHWRDPGDKPGSAASGLPDKVPGIALPSRRTLGKWFDVTSPDGKTHRLRQTDIGPAKWTGKGIDINAAAAEQMGYSPENFPTGGHFKWSPADRGAGEHRHFPGHPGAAPAGASGRALEDAVGMEGLHEVRDRNAIKQYLRSGGAGMDPATSAWCAAFVNASLQREGIKGSESDVATSFLNWGRPATGPIQPGDILVKSRGHQPGQTGGHVGIATGETRQGPGGTEYQMISGNSADRVRRTWESEHGITARRAPVHEAPTKMSSPISMPFAYPRGPFPKLERGGMPIPGHGEENLRVGGAGGRFFDPNIRRALDEEKEWQKHAESEWTARVIDPLYDIYKQGSGKVELPSRPEDTMDPRQSWPETTMPDVSREMRNRESWTRGEGTAQVPPGRDVEPETPAETRARHKRENRHDRKRKRRR